MHAIRYSDVYNAAYSYVAKGDRDIRGRRFIHKCVHNARRQPLRTRFLTLSHLHKAAQSQSIFSGVDTRTIQLLHAEHELASKAALDKLEGMQLQLIQHLWRPSSQLVANMLTQDVRKLHVCGAG